MAGDVFPTHRGERSIIGFAKMDLLDAMTLLSASAELLSLAYLYPRYRKDDRHRRWRDSIAAKDHPRSTGNFIMLFWISGAVLPTFALISYFVEGRK